MNPNTDLTPFATLVQRIDSRNRLLRTWELKGGISAQVTALEVEHDNGSTSKMIVRQHGAVDLKRNPNIAADEFKLLSVLYKNGLPVPKPYYVEATGDLLGTPCIVLEFIEGATEFATDNLLDFAQTMALTLVQIHEIAFSSRDLSFLPTLIEAAGRRINNRPATLDDTLDEGHIRDTLEAVWPLPELNVPALLHGDYWPGNWMWYNGELAAVVDWEDAMLGDPLSDVGNCRFELTWAFGLDAAAQFTKQYRAMMPGLNYKHLPYWDLYATLRPVGEISEWFRDDPASEKRMRDGHRLFREQAFAKLAR